MPAPYWIADAVIYLRKHPLDLGTGQVHQVWAARLGELIAGPPTAAKPRSSLREAARLLHAPQAEPSACFVL